MPVSLPLPLLLTVPLPLGKSVIPAAVHRRDPERGRPGKQRQTPSHNPPPPTPRHAPAAAGAPQQRFTATIPPSAYGAGDMVRWYARAADSAGYQSRLPYGPEPPRVVAADGPGGGGGGKAAQQYYGTVVAPPADQVITPDVPILEW